MNRKLSLVLVLLVATAASAVVLNAYDPGKGIISDEEAAVLIAKHFIMNAPTYTYDGIDGTLLLNQTIILESWPAQYMVVLSFESRQAGYGNRTGQMLNQVITIHIATVKVVDGEVVHAIIDGVWDELEQEELGICGVVDPTDNDMVTSSGTQ